MQRFGALRASVEQAPYKNFVRKAPDPYKKSRLVLACIQLYSSRYKIFQVHGLSPTVRRPADGRTPPPPTALRGTPHACATRTMRSPSDGPPPSTGGCVMGVAPSLGWRTALYASVPHAATRATARGGVKQSTGGRGTAQCAEPARPLGPCRGVCV